MNVRVEVKTAPQHFYYGAGYELHVKSAFCAYFLMTLACPAAIASRAAFDVFAPVIAALSSSWDVFNTSYHFAIEAT
jgi:hypothetical protein